MDASAHAHAHTHTHARTCTLARPSQARPAQSRGKWTADAHGKSAAGPASRAPQPPPSHHPTGVSHRASDGRHDAGHAAHRLGCGHSHCRWGRRSEHDQPPSQFGSRDGVERFTLHTPCSWSTRKTFMTAANQRPCASTLGAGPQRQPTASSSSPGARVSLVELRSAAQVGYGVAGSKCPCRVFTSGAAIPSTCTACRRRPALEASQSVGKTGTTRDQRLNKLTWAHPHLSSWTGSRLTTGAAPHPTTTIQTTATV